MFFKFSLTKDISASFLTLLATANTFLLSIGKSYSEIENTLNNFNQETLRGTVNALLLHSAIVKGKNDPLFEPDRMFEVIQRDKRREELVNKLIKRLNV